MQQPNSGQSGRFLFLDFFRGVFALLMLEGHTFRALLSSSFKAGRLFYYHELLHSLTGPAFLFASGAAFSIVTLPRWDIYRSWNRRTAKRCLRFFSLLAIGYMLHLSYFSLRRTLSESTPEQFAYLLSMDILQCIGFSGLLLQALVNLLPNPKSFFRLMLAGSVAVGLITPFVWEASQHWPLWLGTSVAGLRGSVYPLFPHVGFYFAGAAWGYLFLHFRQLNSQVDSQSLIRKYVPWLAAGAFALALLPVPERYRMLGDMGPDYFFPRLALLSGLLMLFYWAAAHFLPRSNSITVIGRESLFAYAAHLYLLHGSALNPDRNLLKLLGNERSLGEVALVLASLTAAMLLLCWAWSYLKKDHAWKARGLQISLAGYLIYCFVTG